MSKKSTGYATVLPRFEAIINILEALEKGKWNPINPLLSIQSLKERHARSTLVVENYDKVFEFDKIKTSEREAAYAPLNTLVQRVYAAASNCEMAPATLDQVKIYKDLIDGNNVVQHVAERKRQAEKALEKAALKKSAAMPDEAAEPNEEANEQTAESQKRSVSRQAFELRYLNFKRLINLLTVAGTYQTNLSDLTLDALNLFLANLAAANKATNDADKVWADAVNERNACLCGPKDSVYTIVKAIKSELIGMETKTGETYKKVVGLPIASRSK